MTDKKKPAAKTTDKPTKEEAEIYFIAFPERNMRTISRALTAVCCGLSTSLLASCGGGGAEPLNAQTPGPQGPAGVSGYRVVMGAYDAPVGGSNGTRITITLHCPAPLRPLSAGAALGNMIYPNSSAPVGDTAPQDWVVTAAQTGTNPSAYQIPTYMICALAS